MSHLITISFGRMLRSKYIFLNILTQLGNFKNIVLTVDIKSSIFINLDWIISLIQWNTMG